MTSPAPTHDSRLRNSQPPSIVVSYSRLMARQLRLQEKDLGKLLRGTGLSIPALMDDTTLLSKQQQLQIMANAMVLSRDEAFGLKLGQLLTPPTHGPLGFLANSSPNLITAIRDFQNFIPARVSLFHCHNEFEGHDLACHFSVDIQDSPSLYRCMSECFILALIALIEFVLGKTFTEGKIQLSYSRPQYYRSYDAIIHCPVQFNAAVNKLVIPENLLYTANASSNHESYEFALHQCQKILSKLDQPGQPATQRLKRLLLTHPPGQLNEEDAARLNFISKRTLARRLQAEGSTFRDLRDELLMTLATDYLRDTNLSVESIASLLNYHDSSSFRRAFKRWTQQTPQQFRSKLKRAV
ncbi:MAG: AraC family transcriptional regulator [Gammaproteobacteria bacterium]|nr:AraC family transcriptional regulator [Gammaproteobacteria bacterium]